MSTLSILSGGAAQGLVSALEADFGAKSGFAIEGVFGAVGAMRAKLANGHPTDVVILTAAIVAALASEGAVLADSITDIGGVATAIAVRSDTIAPRVLDETSLREAFLASDAIYVPDLEQSTAGIHIAGVLAKLGIGKATRARMRMFPNGATAMAALAAAPEKRPIGCTQVTEILATPGIMLVMALPPGFDLTTIYTAAIVAGSQQRAAAQMLLDLMTSGRNETLRRHCGFV